MIKSEPQWVVEIIEHREKHERNLYVFDEEELAKIFYEDQLYAYQTVTHSDDPVTKEIKKPYQARISAMRGNV